VSINQINILVDKTIASQLVEGGISALNYASKLNGTIQGVFIMSVIAVIFPAMSQMAAGDRLDEMKSYIQKAVMLTILFLIPVTVGIMLFAKPIIILLYARGAFVTSAINLTSDSLFFYSIGMLGFGLREIFSRAFYSLQNTRTPMINALIGILINIILNLALSHFMGIAGLALATSIAACITTILLYMSLTRKIGALIGKQGFVDCLKILIASSLMGILARIFYTLLYPSLGWNSSLIITVMVGAFIYLILIYCMKITYVNEFATGTWEYLRGCKGIQTLILMLKLRRRVCEPSPDYDTVLSSGNGITGVVRARRGAPFIGIVIVTYNNADGLRLMLEQIRNQSFLRYRVFIIDNGSTGNTREYIRGYLERNRNINYYRININLGRAGGFHYGIRLAYDQGAVAIWGLEDNVIPHRYALEALIYESRRLEGKFCLISNTTDRFDRERITDIRSREFRLLRISDITFRGVFIPRIMVDEIGLPRKELYRYFDDLDYSRRALDKGYTFYRVRDSLLLYQEEKEEVRCIKLLRKSYEIPLRSKVDWYYYMRNNRLMHSYREKDKAFRRGQFDLLIGILIVSPNCIPAAMDGLRDGRKGITGRSERYHD
jgi:GT2 family glycosyltransferase